MSAQFTKYPSSIAELKKLVRGLGLIGASKFLVYANGQWECCRDGEPIWTGGTSTVFQVARKNALIGYDGTEGWARPAWDNDRPFRVDVNI